MPLMKPLLILVAAIVLSSCSTLPPPPDINLYMHHARSGIVFCSRVRDGKPCGSVMIAETHKWFMLTPSGWRDLNNYIDDLIRRLESRHLSGNDSSVAVTANDLRRFKAALLNARKGLVYGP